MKTRHKAPSRQEVEVFTKKPWDVPQDLEHHYSLENIAKHLSSFNQVAGQRFYVLDYYKKKIIVDSISSPILCGYPKADADEDGFDFYKRILLPDEWHWINKMNKDAYRIFFATPLEQREKLIISYDLHVRTKNERTCILHHKVVPYQLCNNENMWLGLCSISLSKNKKSGNPQIINTQTGDLYDFIDDQFLISGKSALKHDEKSILEWMVQGESAESMSSLLGVSISTLKRKKWVLYQKIGVNSSAEAIHWAHLAGIL